MFINVCIMCVMYINVYFLYICNYLWNMKRQRKAKHMQRISYRNITKYIYIHVYRIFFLLSLHILACLTLRGYSAAADFASYKKVAYTQRRQKYKINGKIHNLLSYICVYVYIIFILVNLFIKEKCIQNQLSPVLVLV